MEKICQNCNHFGTLKNRGNSPEQPICLAPITTEPPKDGVTRAKFPFVYPTHPNGCCELWTPEAPETQTGS